MKRKAMAEAETISPALHKALMTLYYDVDFAADGWDCDCDGSPDGHGVCLKHLIESACKPVTAILHPKEEPNP
jgi:hypothetical protein